MADQNFSFEHAALEADLKALAAEIQKSREHPEMKNSAEKELVREAIRAFPKLSPQNTPAPTSPTPTQANSPLPQYAQNAPAEVRLEIEYLLDLALHQGLSKALTEAAKSPYFVQDAFHDTLAGKLYPELQKRGIVK